MCLLVIRLQGLLNVFYLNSFAQDSEIVSFSILHIRKFNSELNNPASLRLCKVSNIEFSSAFADKNLMFFKNTKRRESTEFPEFGKSRNPGRHSK